MASKTEELRTFSLPTQPRCSAALPSVQSSSIARDLQPGTVATHLLSQAVPAHRGLAGLGSFIHGTQRFLQLVLSELSEHRLHAGCYGVHKIHEQGWFR